MNPRVSIRWPALAVALLLVGLGAGYWWGHGSEHPAARAEVADSGTTQPGERKILYWHDPMQPDQHFDKPGKSPYMDMDLVPVYADETEGTAAVRVSAGTAQNLGIRIGRVETAPLGTRLHAVGSVAFDDRLLELVPARVDGSVTKLYVHAPLEQVRRGQPLAEILSPQWLEAEQEYLALLDVGSDAASALRAAARQRLAVLGVPEATIQAVETTRKTLATTTVRAPIDGTVTELGVREGSAFMTGSSLFRINGLATVWVNAQIPEAQVSMVPPGSSVAAHATAWPGMTFNGRVLARLPQVDPQTRTLPVRVALDNPGLRLSPGMFVSLDFTQADETPVLVVPTEAVIVTGERSVVIVARDGGGFDVVDVTVGREQGGRSEILSGLTEGQSIVLSGQFLIDSEASLKSTINRLEETRP